MQFPYTLQYIVLKKMLIFGYLTFRNRRIFSPRHTFTISIPHRTNILPRKTAKSIRICLRAILPFFFLSKPVQINRILPQSTYCLLHTIIFFFPFLLAIFAHYLYFCIVFLYTLVKKSGAEEDILQLICPYTINNNTIMTGIHDFLLSDINTTAHSLSHKKMGCRAFSPCVSLHPGFSFNS